MGKNAEIQKFNQHEWYLKNKSRLIAEQKDRRRRRRQEFLEFKRTLACIKCGESHPGCLDFHHKDPSQKDGLLSVVVNANWPMHKIKAEIAKCEVLCANCHRKEHFDELGNIIRQ